MIADLIATAATPSALENASVVASIAVSLLTVGSILIGLLFFIFKVHTNQLQHSKEMERMKSEHSKDMELMKAEAAKTKLDLRRIELVLVSKRIIVPNPSGGIDTSVAEGVKS